MRSIQQLIRRMRPLWAASALWVFTLVLAPSAWAHKSSDAYLRVADVAEVPSTSAAPGAPQASRASKNAIALNLSIALKDVDAALEQLDADGDRQLTWGEVGQATPAITEWVGNGVQWQCGGSAVTPPWGFEALEERTDGRYVRLATSLECAPGQALTVRYGLMQGIDPTHRLLIAGTLSGQPLAAVLAPDGRPGTDLRAAGAKSADSTVSQEPGATRSGVGTLLHFVSEGVHHILEGYDHLAFLLALLLPISLTRRRAPFSTETGAPQGESLGRRAGLKALIVTVTSFTIGHSVTLVLAGIGWVTVSGNWVEPAIAISIGISALLNLFPIKGLRTSWLALGFGLIHGLGFSGALIEAGVSGSLLVWALAGFNLGVEAGQLMVVAVWCAVSIVLMRWSLYRTVVVRGGSVALLLLSLYWTVQRVAFS